MHFAEWVRTALDGTALSAVERTYVHLLLSTHVIGLATTLERTPAAGTGFDADRLFEFGMDCVLDGLTRFIDHRTPGGV